MNKNNNITGRVTQTLSGKIKVRWGDSNEVSFVFNNQLANNCTISDFKKGDEVVGVIRSTGEIFHVRPNNNNNNKNNIFI